MNDGFDTIDEVPTALLPKDKADDVFNAVNEVLKAMFPEDEADDGFDTVDEVLNAMFPEDEAEDEGDGGPAFLVHDVTPSSENIVVPTEIAGAELHSTVDGIAALEGDGHNLEPVDVVQAQLLSSAPAILQDAHYTIQKMISTDIHHIVEVGFEPLHVSADAVLNEFPPWEFADTVVQSTSSANEQIGVAPQSDVVQDSPLNYEVTPVIGPPAVAADPDPAEEEATVRPAGSRAVPAPSVPTVPAPPPVATQQGIVQPRASSRRQTRQTGTSHRVSMPRNRPKSTRKPPDKWTRDQQHRFEHALKVHGRCWQAVSAYVKREVSSVKSHAQKHFISLAKALQRVPDKVAETGVGHTLRGSRLVLSSSSSLGYLPNVNIEELQSKLDELYDEHEREIELKKESAANQILQAPAAQ
jgi:hypothetical protein